MTAITEDVLPAAITENTDRTVLSAQFWRSPFAVAAAMLVTVQGLILTYANLSGAPVNHAVTMPMIIIAMMLLAAGVFPRWNFIAVDNEGFEQHAGLTGVKTDWRKVQNVRVFSSWVEIRHVHGDTPGEKKVRTIRLLNRYGLSAEDFGALIEEHWRAARGLEF